MCTCSMTCSIKLHRIYTRIDETCICGRRCDHNACLKCGCISWACDNCGEPKRQLYCDYNNRTILCDDCVDCVDIDLSDIDTYYCVHTGTGTIVEYFKYNSIMRFSRDAPEVFSIRKL